MKQFIGPNESLGDLSAESAAAVISAAADIALIVDDDGVIRDLALGSDELSEVNSTDWLGKAWADTVTIESRPKIEEMLHDAASSQQPRWRQVNHPTSNGADVPIRYSTLQIGGTGPVIALGRELRSVAALQQRLVAAQQAMEREYGRLRQAETRYRLLFQLSSEAVMIVEAATGRVAEINPAACAVFGTSPQDAVGAAFIEMFAEASRGDVAALLGATRSAGESESVRVRLTSDDAEYDLGLSIFRQGAASHYLARVSPVGGRPAETSVAGRSALLRVMEKSPDGFVVVDSDWRILGANTAFLEMAELAAEDQVRGQPLETWVGRSGVDFRLLCANLVEHGVVRLFGTAVRGQYGALEEVEVSAVSALHDDAVCYGLTVRNVGRRLRGRPSTTGELPRTANQLTELVGRVSLKEIVRETTDLIEKLCIEAALELTDNNRASASELLGLSRQSLYVKLRRFELTDGDGDGEAGPQP